MDALRTSLQSYGFDKTSLAAVAYGGTAPIYHCTLPYAACAAGWLKLREVAPPLGYWPVITDTLDPITAYADNQWAGSPEQILAEAARHDPLTFILDLAQQPQYPTAEAVLDATLEELEEFRVALGEDWGDHYTDLKQDITTALTSDALWVAQTPSTNIAHLGFALPPEGFSQTMHAVFLPTRQWWEIPALIRYYPADPGPEPGTHLLFWRWWAQRYGAELVALGRGSCTLRTSAPLATPAQALTLAWEQRIYCNHLLSLDCFELAQRLFQGAAWSCGWRD